MISCEALKTKESRFFIGLSKRTVYLKPLLVIPECGGLESDLSKKPRAQKTTFASLTDPLGAKTGGLVFQGWAAQSGLSQTGGEHIIINARS